MKQTDCNAEEREDLKEELLSHLYCAYEDLQKQGYPEEEAMKMAMENFGDEKEVGKQLQHAMYPYRREMMIGLAGVSLLFIYSTYLLQLFIIGDAEMIWLCLAVLVSASILTLTMHPVAALNRRLMVNGLLIAHILLAIYGSLLAGYVDSPYSSILVWLWIGIILFSIILVYRTTIYDYPSSSQTLQKDAKRIHFVNLTVGLLVMALSLFLLWAFMIFAAEMSASLLLLAIPLVIWAVLYAIQLRLLAAHRKKTAYSVAAFQLLSIVAVIVIWIS
ncbi:permease prefix domain 1-containing protein [Sporosarcina sp. P37]|uniref:permease prefix domain 1-containing protein n=1 Tax=Sporosarcina sp. P37 TaxID=1930546 RepID=UPI0012F4B5AF|nr:permease prefix domain 1-containing protein [Sporosarcina sp. P37]